MKLYKILSFASIVAVITTFSSCKKLLEEQPRSGIVPSFFNSPAGVLGGIAGVYDDIRNFWGTEGFSLQSVAGTDEHLIGGGNAQRPFFFYENLTTGAMNNGWWNAAYQDINTLNGVLEFGQSIALPEATRKAYLAQAKFLRAFWYYHLVLTFGDIPLHTTFITVPSSADSRAPIAEIYALIIKDLTEAAADLPNIPTAPFLGKAATKPTAMYLLGKTYLTRGWSSAAQANDFNTAYTTLKDIIDNKASYGLDLWQNYADAFKPGPLSVNTNDYGKETLFVSDHSIDVKYGNYPSNGNDIHGIPGTNLTPWFNRWNYPALSNFNVWVNNNKLSNANAGSTMMTRDVENGRPYLRVRPNSYLWNSGPNTGKRYIFDAAFTDRVNDSRYNNTFQTVWMANKRVGDNVDNPYTTLTNSATATNNQRGITYDLVPLVDTAVWFTDFDVTNAPQFNGSVPFKGLIIPPRLWDEQYFPAVKKFDDPFRAAANFNWPSTRPVVIWRFSDVYLLAAEAAFKAGNNDNAAAMINAVRQRAAFRPSNSAAQNAAAALAMTITSGQINLDFILNERSREFYGEWCRWWDLVRTKSLISRVKAWNPEAGNNIQDFHALRPIPQDQIDRVTEGPKFPQNPGY